MLPLRRFSFRVARSRSLCDASHSESRAARGAFCHATQSSSCIRIASSSAGLIVVQVLENRPFGYLASFQQRFSIWMWLVAVQGLPANPAFLIIRTQQSRVFIHAQNIVRESPQGDKPRNGSLILIQYVGLTLGNEIHGRLPWAALGAVPQRQKVSFVRRFFFEPFLDVLEISVRKTFGCTMLCQRKPADVPEMINPRVRHLVSSEEHVMRGVFLIGRRRAIVNLHTPQACAVGFRQLDGFDHRNHGSPKPTRQAKKGNWMARGKQLAHASLQTLASVEQTPLQEASQWHDLYMISSRDDSAQKTHDFRVRAPIFFHLSTTLLIPSRAHFLARSNTLLIPSRACVFAKEKKHFLARGNTLLIPSRARVFAKDKKIGILPGSLEDQRPLPVFGGSTYSACTSSKRSSSCMFASIC